MQPVPTLLSLAVLAWLAWLWRDSHVRRDRLEKQYQDPLPGLRAEVDQIERRL
jgi:hypothetical protein